MSVPFIARAVRFLAEEAKNKTQGLSGGPAITAVKKAASHLAACQTTGCDKFTLGVVCAQCSKHACQAHGFMTLTVPPAFVCAECIAQEFEIIRDKVIVEPPDPPKPAAKRSSR